MTIPGVPSSGPQPYGESGVVCGEEPETQVVGGLQATLQGAHLLPRTRLGRAWASTVTLPFRGSAGWEPGREAAIWCPVWAEMQVAKGWGRKSHWAEGRQRGEGLGRGGRRR